MRIKFENEILNQQTRMMLIQEIEGQENRSRKAEAYKRYQCYKDKTNDYVIDLLLRQFDTATVYEMRYAISNVSLVRKIIDKLSRVYAHGAERKLDSEENTKKLQDLAKKLCVQTEMKKANRFLKLQKNLALYVKPCPEYTKEGTVEKWGIKLESLNPFHYDVVEDYHDRTKPMVFVLSNYVPEIIGGTLLDSGARISGLTNTVSVNAPLANNKDEKIADTPKDQGQGEMKTYVFWSKNYHFTCDQHGNILQDTENPQNENPFGVCPVINLAIDQDGSFWAEGGRDLIDGAILLNSLISHIVHVGVVQGYGQFYMTGENLPTSVKVGPNKVIRAEYKKDEQAKPEFGFLNANPELDSLRGLVEMYLALLLTSNNLSTSGVATQLSGGANIASGIALVIDKAESLEDVQDQRQLFIDKEPEIFHVINSILRVYGSQMDDEMKGLQLPDNFKESFNIKFIDQQTIMSEKEKLDNMKLRKELGIDSMISLLMKDDPSLTHELAEEKLKMLIEERIKERMLEAEVQKALGVEVVPPDQDPNAQDPNAPKEPNEDIEDDNIEE